MEHLSCENNQSSHCTTFCDEEPVFENTMADKTKLHREFPSRLVIPLDEALDELMEGTPEELGHDFIPIVEIACKLYCGKEEFFSVEDEVFDSYDNEAFISNFKDPDPEYMMQLYEHYCSAVSQFIRYLLALFQEYRVPYFSHGNCVYKPDEIHLEQKVLVLKIELE